MRGLRGEGVRSNTKHGLRRVRTTLRRTSPSTAYGLRTPAARHGVSAPRPTRKNCPHRAVARRAEHCLPAPCRERRQPEAAPAMPGLWRRRIRRSCAGRFCFKRLACNTNSWMESNSGCNAAGHARGRGCPAGRRDIRAGTQRWWQALARLDENASTCGGITSCAKATQPRHSRVVAGAADPRRGLWHGAALRGSLVGRRRRRRRPRHILKEYSSPCRLWIDASRIPRHDPNLAPGSNFSGNFRVSNQIPAKTANQPVLRRC